MPGKASIPGFVPNLAVPGQLSPLALPHYPAVDPAAASALQGCLAAAFDGSGPQPSFGGSCLSGSIMFTTHPQASCLPEYPVEGILACSYGFSHLKPLALIICQHSLASQSEECYCCRGAKHDYVAEQPARRLGP